MTFVRRLVGIYDAEGTLRGELTYLFARSLGRAHCALCDITHGRLRPRRDFQQAVLDLPVAFDFVHTDTSSPGQRAASGGLAPCVLAETDAGTVVVLGRDEIERCAGDPTALIAAIRRVVDELGLRWSP